MSASTVKITGLGCICAAGTTLPETMQSLYQGARNPAPPTRIQADLDTPYPVFEVKSDLDYPDAETTRTTRLAIEATAQALLSARLAPDMLGRKRVGVCIGTTVGCTLNNEPYYRNFKKGTYDDLQPIKKYLNNNPAMTIARSFNFKGPVSSVVNACSSGTDAIGLAKSWIEHDLCDIVIAGGTDELSRITYLGFISLLNTSPEPCRPFDINRKGLNLGEGAGICILESAQSVSNSDRPILAELIGYGTAADAYHPTAPHPEGAGLKAAIHQALHMAHIELRQVDFINAHGTATPENDKIEGKVIAALFRQGIPVVSTKAYTGHTLGGAGGIEAVLTVQALLDQKLPETLGFTDIDPACGIEPTRSNLSIDASIGLSNSLAFGGNNSALVFRRTD